MTSSETELSDAQFLRRYVENGDTEAFAGLQRRYGGMVHAACLRELRDNAMAEDATQGAFLLLSQRAAQLTDHVCLAGWLFQSAIHISRNLARQERRRLQREQLAMKHVLSEERREEAWERVEPELNGALESLPAMDRTLVLLRFVQELPLAEVGQQMGLTENAARMRVSRALERMAKTLRRRGVVLSATLLGLLMTERATARQTPTPPPGVPTPSLRVIDALPSGAWLASMPFPVPFATVAGFLTVAVAGGAFWFTRTDPSPTVSPEERRQIFARSVGIWSGTLEYADDQSTAHYTYPTNVTVESLPRDGIRLTSRYIGSSAVDVTTFQPDANGKVRIDNGGENASHVLDGTYDFIRLPNGLTAFRGISAQLTREVQLVFTVQANSTVIEEQYRKPDQTTWQFRNRFTLKRVR